MEQALQFCAARVREADRDRYLATLFAPAPLRGPLFALYAFDAEVARIRDRVTSPLPGEVRLQWWRDALSGSDDVVGHPIATALLDAVQRFALAPQLFGDLIDAHAVELYDEPMATFAALEHYADNTAGNVIRLAARILNDGAEPGQDTGARHAGIALTIVGLLQHLSPTARGRRLLPGDVLARHGLDVAVIGAGRVTTELRSALAELRQAARANLVALKANEHGVPDRMLPAFLPLSLLPQALARMEQADADPFDPQVVPQWRRQWMLWRAARDPARFIAVNRD
jgi:phytoene synthase